MKKSGGWIVLLALVVAIALSIVRAVRPDGNGIDNILAVKAVENGKTLIATGDERNYTIYLLRADATTERQASFSRKKQDTLYQVADIGIDNLGQFYVLRDHMDALTGAYRGQDLLVYRTGGFSLNRTRLFTVGADERQQAYRYRWLSVSSSLVLTGVNGAGDAIMRLSYDLELLQSTGQAAVKTSRIYPADPRQGVYQAVAAGSDTAYISKSGKVFLSQENGSSPQEIFPGKDESRVLSYATFAAPSGGGTVLVGEQESGNILRVTPGADFLDIVRNGMDSIVDNRDYRMQNVFLMSMLDERNYAAVVQNPDTFAFEIISSNDGNSSLITGINASAFSRVTGVLGYGALYFAAAAALMFVVVGFVRVLRNSRTILLKLACVTIPLLILALVMFGTYSYSSYKENIDSSFAKQAQDEGNLLAALMGSDVFNKISYPRDYNNEDYQYVSHQFGTRSCFVSSAYYEGPGTTGRLYTDKLYTGIDGDYPCFYDFGVMGSQKASEMYRRAALTGQAQMGRLTDSRGSRIVCITPIGGTSGSSVFLLETSIFTANLDQYTMPFIQRYLLISGIFLLAVTTLLLIVFIRILEPLGRIIDGLEEFSLGNRKVRLKCDTNDELADICRVFNKMAGDIDTQIFTLRSLSDTYYRFIPQRIFQLLGKDNLGELQLGSSVEGKYNILCVNLHLKQRRMGFQQTQDLTNTFFNIVNTVSERQNAILINDSVNLRELKIICPSGDAAVGLAMDAIAHIDSHNASSAVQDRLEVSFLLDMSCMNFSICGDENRYIPAMIAGDLEWISRQSEMFRQLSSRLIVTSEAYQNLNADNYFHRFIGLVEGSDSNLVGLYDFYDSSAPVVIRLLNSTRDAFDKAMDLYRQQRYYDAKNLFTVVLRENQYDNVARHYIFQCEKQM